MAGTERCQARNAFGVQCAWVLGHTDDSPRDVPHMFDPEVETSLDLVKDIAKGVGCVCSTLVKLTTNQRAGSTKACIVCRAQAILKSVPCGTAAEQVASRSERLFQMDEWIKNHKTKKRPDL